MSTDLPSNHQYTRNPRLENCTCPTPKSPGSLLQMCQPKQWDHPRLSSASRPSTPRFRLLCNEWRKPHNDHSSCCLLAKNTCLPLLLLQHTVRTCRAVVSRSHSCHCPPLFSHRSRKAFVKLASKLPTIGTRTSKMNIMSCRLSS